MADVPVGIETLAGGGVTGMLVAVMYAFLRRTKDTDARRDDLSRIRDEAAKTIMTEALRREQFAWDERNKAVKDLETLRAHYEMERERWMIQARQWRTNPESPPLQE